MPVSVTSPYLFASLRPIHHVGAHVIGEMKCACRVKVSFFVPVSAMSHVLVLSVRYKTLFYGRVNCFDLDNI